MKKLLYVTLFLALLAAIFTLTASAATYGELTYTVSNGEVTITDCDESATSLVIPSKINGYPVTKIGDGAFDWHKNLMSVTIPSSVTSIGMFAFDNCTGITSIIIPSSVTSIGDCAFRGCKKLQEVYITDIVAWCNISFGGDFGKASADANPLYYADNFYLNGELLTNLIIPDGVTNISAYAFCNRKQFLSVTIPSSVTYIAEYAFNNCSNIVNVITPDIKSWCNIDFVNEYSNPLRNGANLYADNNVVKNLDIPKGVTQIDDFAFSGCSSIKSVTIPDSVIVVNGFNECNNLESVNFAEESGCESIGNTAFTGCYSLVDINIPDGIKSIGDGAFSRTGIRKISLPNSLTNIGGAAFCASYITKVFIPNSVTFIGNEAFSQCNLLNSVTFDKDSKCESIGYRTFYHCTRLASITIPESVKSIGFEAFYYCNNLKSVYITNMVAWCTIDFAHERSSPFYHNAGNTGTIYLNGEKVINLVIPSTVSNISQSAFWNCSSITSVEFPESVTSIASGTFSQCENLKKIIIPSTTTLISNGAFPSLEEVHGFFGSYAQDYADVNDYTFVPLNEVVYEIKYNLAGGEGELETGKKGVYADYYITSTIPTKLHCTFLGWATEEKGEVVYKSGDVYSANSSLNLYAVWQEPETIINGITVTPGESFWVDIVLENCVPIKGVTINDIEYSDTLTLTNAEWILTDSILSSVDINGDSLIAFQNAIDANKAVMRLYFTADSELPDQDAYIRYKAKGTDEENVVFDFVTYEGAVKIRNFIVGDCDGDDTITIDDAIHLAFYTFYSDRYPIPNGMNVDFNKDGEVTIDDAIYLAFHTFYQDRYPLN